jgi:hypothetical protein
LRDVGARVRVEQKNLHDRAIRRFEAFGRLLRSMRGWWVEGSFFMLPKIQTQLMKTTADQANTCKAGLCRCACNLSRR